MFSENEGKNKLKKTQSFINYITQEIKQKFPRLNFYKDENFIADEEDGIFHIKIVEFNESDGVKIFRNGVEEIYSTFKHVFNSLHIDFNRFI